ncbi:transcriptional regulator [Pseudaminobacter sp. NGMCC 1.201702]|uniref:transcriptional regulator n=1 Tax=Pseudaminobacter sp. NGMCC 1.201702 TaxID=3391825 RepID=UPI0039F0948A
MSVKESEAERVRAQDATLTRHYRAIGSAAILAAVLAAKPSKPTVRSAKAA